MLGSKHIGDCDFCPSKGVVIVSGWSTRDKKRCNKCHLSENSRKKREKLQNMPKVGVLKGTCIECAFKGKVDRSHILSRGAHPELADEPENIVLHCRACHMRWETGDSFSMRTWELKKDWIGKHSMIGFNAQGGNDD